MPRLDEYVGKDPESVKEDSAKPGLISARIVKAKGKNYIIFPGWCEVCGIWEREVVMTPSGRIKCKSCSEFMASPFEMKGREVQIGYGKEEEETTPELGKNAKETIRTVRDAYIRKGVPWCQARTDEEAISEVVHQYSLNAPIPGWEGINNRNAVSKFYYGDLEGLNPN